MTPDEEREFRKRRLEAYRQELLADICRVEAELSRLQDDEQTVVQVHQTL